ncbi:MAG TPA: ABC transporter permease [Terriglobales bacterium]|nr:ABC transporter permease [Terriglobales bacterium]
MMNLRLAIRSLWKSPAFTIVSLVVLALGIGANTAIFSVVNAVLLRPLPYKNAGRIVALQTLWANTKRLGPVSLPDFLDWRNQSQSFQAMALYQNGPDSISANDLALQVNAAMADAQFFKVFGVSPQLGRTYVESDKQQTGTPVMVISDSLWRRVFHADRQALGKLVKLDQREFTVIGVMPPGFDFPDQSELWVPDYQEYTPYRESRSGHNYEAVALFNPGVDLQHAQAEMTIIGSRLAQQYPKDNARKNVAVSPLRDVLVRQVRMTLYLLLASVALILLIACANIANLLLAKVTVRRREMAIRAALGASRTQIVRQLLAESLVLAVSAGALGLLLGWWSAQALARLAPAELTANAAITFDWRVALFVLCASLLCTVIFGLAPAFQASHTDLRSALHTSVGGYSGTGGSVGKLRAVIIVAEIAMSMSLLVGAAVLIRSLIALNSVDPGYRIEGLTVMRSAYPAVTIEDAKKAVKFYSSLLSSASSIPGIKEAAATNKLPTNGRSNGGFSIEGRPDPPPGEYFNQSAGYMLVSPNYFRTLGIPFLSGRDFNERDSADGQLTCIINEQVVSEAFAGEDPIGRRIKTGYDNVNGYKTIVGVVAGVRQNSLEKPPGPYIYMPYQQHPLPATNMQILFRDTGNAAPELRSEAHRLDPEVAVDFEPLTKVVDQAFAPSRFRSGMLGLFAALALILAVAGLYGVMSYTVEQRRSEIGVRMALGAQKGNVVQLILGQGLWLVVPGVILGCALAFAAGRVFVSLVYGMSASDPATFLGIAVLLVIVALLAMYVPARRAAGVDPMLALRSE